jgi:hypothetical protein
MSRRMRAYYYAVLGAIGGLLAWRISDTLGLSFTPNLYLSEEIVGALMGLCVGLLIGATEGAVTLSPARALRASLFTGPLGLAAGAIGLPLSELAFQLAGGEIIGRVLGWGLFSLARPNCGRAHSADCWAACSAVDCWKVRAAG